MCRRLALLWGFIAAAAIAAACQPGPTPTPTPPPVTATFIPRPTETPPGGPLVIFWSIVNAVATADRATYTVRINASGGIAPYTYYHDDVKLSGATFTVEQLCPPARATTFNIRVESSDGQTDAMQGALPLACPAPAPGSLIFPTEQGVEAVAQPDRPPADRPAFYALTFGSAPDVPPTSLFAFGAPGVFARWRFQKIAPGETVRRQIRFAPARAEPGEARIWREETFAWSLGADGDASYLIETDPPGAPLEPGAYTLRLALASDPYRFVEATFVVFPAPVDLGGAARFGVEAATDASQTCLLWQIGPGSADLDYRALNNPTDLLTSWGARDFAAAPDGARIAYVSVYPGLGGGPVRQPRVFNWEDGADAPLDAEDAVSAPVWSGDGMLLAVEGTAGVTVFDATGGEPLFFLPGAAHPRFAPADQRLAYVRDGATLVIREPGGEERHIVASAWETLGEIAWANDGARLYYVEQGPQVRPGPGGYANGVLWTVDMWGSQPERWSVNTYVSLRDLRISPGGRYLLAKDGVGAIDGCGIDERLHVFDLQADDPMRQDRTLWDISGGGESDYLWLSDKAFLLVRRPLCSGLAADFVRVEAANGRAAWLGGLPGTSSGPACR